MLIGDQAFDADLLLDGLEKRKIVVVIPPKKNRTDKREYDRDVHKWQSMVENFFSRIKDPWLYSSPQRPNWPVTIFLANIRIGHIVVCIRMHEPVRLGGGNGGDPVAERVKTLGQLYRR